jgi:nicotinate-nucleotide pyrophosphorylase (carboxylating)
MIYKQITEIPEQYIINSIDNFLNEDMPEGDATTDTIFSNNEEIVTAEIEAKEDLVISGINLLKYFFPENKIDYYYKDSERVKKKSIIAKIYAMPSDILKKERVLLNLIQRMSGIATFTAKYVEKVSKYNIFILDTRKTTPGLRYFEKYAVNCGGGSNHRFDLSSAVMIKDNHIAAAGSIQKAIELVLNKKLNKIIEVEVDNIEQLQQVIKYPIDAVLLDNFTKENTLKAVKLIRNNALNRNLFIESSGGINMQNIDEYLNTGINAISSGSLTHSVKSSDISLNIKYCKK